MHVLSGCLCIILASTISAEGSVKRDLVGYGHDHYSHATPVIETPLAVAEPVEIVENHIEGPIFSSLPYSSGSFGGHGHGLATVLDALTRGRFERDEGLAERLAIRREEKIAREEARLQRRSYGGGKHGHGVTLGMAPFGKGCGGYHEVEHDIIHDVVHDEPSEIHIVNEAPVIELDHHPEEIEHEEPEDEHTPVNIAINVENEVFMDEEMLQHPHDHHHDGANIDLAHDAGIHLARQGANIYSPLMHESLMHRSQPISTEAYASPGSISAPSLVIPLVDTHHHGKDDISHYVESAYSHHEGFL